MLVSPGRLHIGWLPMPGALLRGAGNGENMIIPRKVFIRQYFRSEKNTCFYRLSRDHAPKNSVFL